MSTSVWLLCAAAVAGFAAAWLAFELRRAWSPESLRQQSNDDEFVAYVRALGVKVERMDAEIAALRDALQRAASQHDETMHEREIYQRRGTGDASQARIETSRLQEYLAERRARSDPR